VSITANETSQNDGPRPKPALRRRNLGTRIFTSLLIAGAIGVDVALFVHLRSGTSGWRAFACFAAAAAITQLLVTRGSSSRNAHESLAVFIVAAALVLPPELVVLVPIVQHIPEWLKQRYAWTAQAASIACATLAAFAPGALPISFSTVMGSPQAEPVRSRWPACWQRQPSCSSITA